MDSFAPGRRAVVGFALALLGLGIGASAPASADPSPIEPIRQLNDGLLKIMHDGRGTPFNQRFQALAPIVEQTFDLQAVLEDSVGPTWSTLTPAEQALLMDAFRRYTIASYVNSFDNFSGQKFDVSPDPQSLPNGELVVNTRIVPASGTGHALDYVMRKTGNGWRAVDVLADGSISRVAVQRSDFRRLLRSGGPTALAESLQNKSADLAGGTA
ncbi:MAG TPA: ABC transporter substrate-binding protein [Rhodopila sp.]|uniref:ABC transporter substrate-binding protein n=1 Tax=Rhodopila sp. TaxID=2480087 RepID=UPI002C8D470C|nr:ABC transporter substrate-binding protein [Rhodopila sp.]HVY17578.1 ABC transporter substrate-binding protein [Rhodopila sp.]